MLPSDSFELEPEPVPSSGDDLPRTGYFLPLLSAVRAANPNVPIDPVILKYILLCLVAPGVSNRNLMFRVREEDLTLVQNLTAVILSKVFGYPTQKAKTRTKQSPSELLHSLFLHDKTYSRRPHANRRSGRSVNRSSSEPSELTLAVGDTKEWNSVILKPLDQSQRRPRVRPLEVHTDPVAPTLKDFESFSSAGNGSDQMLLPKAIVFTGLEHSVPSQRALLEVLSERRVTFDDETEGVWILPEDFIIIYVCPLDLRERPKIHTSLLDRFAISVALSPSTATRQLYAMARSDLQTPSTPSNPIISPTDVGYLQNLPVNFHPSLLLHMNDMITAARHHRELDGTLLSARVHKDAEALIRAQRVLCGDSGSTDLIRSVQRNPTHDESEEFMTPVQEFYDEMKTVQTSIDWLEEEKRRRSSSDDAADRSGSSEEYGEYEDSVIQRSRTQDERLDVSHQDVDLIVTRVMSHRLRVRDGPDQEVFSSVMYPAAMPGLHGFQKRTINEILSTAFKE